MRGSARKKINVQEKRNNNQSWKCLKCGKCKKPIKCHKCALCCRNLHPYLLVELSHPEDDHIPDVLRVATEYNGKLVMAMRKNVLGNCVMLDPVKNKCMIYDYRPKECREFKPGCRVCGIIRGEYGSFVKTTSPNA